MLLRTATGHFWLHLLWGATQGIGVAGRIMALSRYKYQDVWTIAFHPQRYLIHEQEKPPNRR